MYITMKLESAIRKEVCYVELVNGDGLPIGITVGDAYQDAMGPVIKSVQPKSLAERCHAVAEGDVILAVNGTDVVGRRRKDVQRMLKESGPKINLKLLHDVFKIGISGFGIYSKQQMTAKLKKVGNSFGFILRWKNYQHSFMVEYPVITTIKRGGPADTNGLMQEGDRLLKIDEISLSWLPQADIACLLQDRREAEFTFEYDVRLHDSSTLRGRTVNLDVGLPSNVNLGIKLYLSRSSGLNAACIRSIERCSIAERCGIFKEDDIIVSINSISTQSLTESQASLLLRSPGKIKKLSFVSQGRHANSDGLHKSSLCVHKKRCLSSESSTEVEAVSHPNTPGSINTTISSNQKSKSIKDLCYGEQVKAIQNFHDVLKHMTLLKELLSQLMREAFQSKGNFGDSEENCIACKITQHSVKLCASCLSKMNVKCVQSMDFLKNIIILFASSVKLRKFPPFVEKANMPTVTDAKTEAAVPIHLVHSLRKTLPNFFAGKSELEKSFRTLADKIVTANASCRSCNDEISSASLTTQKLLLLISLNDPTKETNVLINQLVYCLLETKIPCDADASSSHSLLEEESITESEHAVQFPQSGSTASNFATSSPRTVSQQTGKVEFYDVDLDESPEDNNEVGDDPNPTFHVKVDTSQHSACFRLTNVESTFGSETSASGDTEFSETAKIGNCYSKANKSTPALKENVNMKSSPADGTEPTWCKGKKIHKDKGLLSIPAKILNSLDSFLHPKKVPQTQSESNSNLKACGSKDFLDIPRPPSINLRDHLSGSSGRRDSKGSNGKNSESNSQSTLSSAEGMLTNHKEAVKTHKETVEVRMSNEGEGFGFVLGFSSSTFADTLPIPIITAIKPKSPADRSGILAIKDRVLAINGQSIVGILLKDLEKLKRQVFNSSSITLLIEFDVVDTQLQFGVVNVVLDKTLKAGLIFEDMRKGCPMLVTGVVKGSAAHRSGRLFPGDKVIFMKCVRTEEFNPISCNYNREEFIKITIKRERQEGIKESPIKPSQTPTAGPSSSQTGMNFILKQKSIRSIEGSDTVVLDHELTLFRDPVSWDFGFLVGENPVTGRAFVTDVKPGGPAAASGVMKKMDRIIEINGITVGKDEDCSVLSLLTQANDKVDLLTRRIYHEDANLAPHQSRNYKLPPFL